MVGLLPPGRRTPDHLRTGRLGTPTYAALLLGTLARLAGKAAQATPSGGKGTPAEGGPQLPRSVAFGRHRQPAHRTTQRNPTPTRLPIAIRLARYHVTERLCSIAGCEKRTSGGVGGCRGAISGTRPDHTLCPSFACEICGLALLAATQDPDRYYSCSCLCR